MSFEPSFEHCQGCELYKSGDGKSSISRCLVEDGHEPPEYCPMASENKHSYLKRNELCPKCKAEITEDYLSKNTIMPDDTFDCPVCGALLTYCVLCKMGEGLQTFGEEYLAVFLDSEMI